MDVRDMRRPTDYLRRAYVRLLQEIGVTPLLVPNALDDPQGYVMALRVEGLVLTGGGDVAPTRYGQANDGSRGIAPERDETEWRLLDLALAQGWPVLGICRGLQVLNLYLGGSLIQDLPAHKGRFLPHDSDDPHPVRLVDAAVSALLNAETLLTNTYHHQGVTAAELSSELIPFAVCSDGVIEGVRHRTLPLLAVQWHPERPTPSAQADRRLLSAFLRGEL